MTPLAPALTRIRQVHPEKARRILQPTETKPRRRRRKKRRPVRAKKGK